MHPCLNVDEILRLIACELVASGAKGTTVTLACCCKSFEEPVLDALWGTQDQLTPLLKCFPRDAWEEGDEGFVSLPAAFILLALNCLVRKAFKRIPTKVEWAHSRKYARRMRKIMVDASKDSVTSDTLQVLQLRTVNSPWFSGLRAFHCKESTKAFIPFIPSFLSPKTSEINIGFAGTSPTVAVATLISKIPTICRDLVSAVLCPLPKDPVITEAVSEMVLACNRDTLQVFRVDSPLTEEAREVVYQLPRLSSLRAIIQGPTSLPTVTLPNLTSIDVEYDNGLNWLQGFRGATLEKLESVIFRTEANDIGDFLGAFKSVALTTSIKNTLSQFGFGTSRSWNPSYSSLLLFNQLEKIEIQFSCKGGCSSKIDDNIIVSLGQAMPKLEILCLGRTPCAAPTGITVNGLVALACHCPRLSILRIHFQVASLVEAATSATTPLPSGEPVVRLEDCALTKLEVGKTPIPARSGLTVAHILLHIFPRLLNIKYTNQDWKTVEETIQDFRRIGGFIHRTSKAHLLHI